MENRDQIVRKLRALKAMFEHGATSETEAALAMKRYNDLMQKYHLTETDLEIKQSGIHTKNFKTSTGKQKGPMYYLAKPIGNVTNTRGIYHRKTGVTVYFGTQADVDYAEFLFRLIESSLEQSWNAYRYSFDYTRLHRDGVHGRTIRNAFYKGYITRMQKRLNEMALENIQESTGRDLIVLKGQLIQTAIEEAGIKIKKGTSLSTKVRTNAMNAVEAGRSEADKVKLRHEMDTGIAGYLEGK